MISNHQDASLETVSLEEQVEWVTDRYANTPSVNALHELWGGMFVDMADYIAKLEARINSLEARLNN